MRRALILGGLGAVAVLAGVALAQEPPAPSSASPAPGGPSPTTEAPAPDVPPSAVPPEEPAPVQAAPPPPEAPAEPPPPPKPVEPLKRPRFAAAVLQATDKVTAETLRFEAKLGEPVRYRGVVITVRACETTAADEPAFDSVAHLDVTSQPQAAPGRPTPPPRQAFRGWMFANSPALHPFEHPVYDLWLIACKTPAPAVAAGSA